MYMINIVLYTILWYTIGFRIVQISSTKFIMTWIEIKKGKKKKTSWNKHSLKTMNEHHPVINEIKGMADFKMNFKANFKF
jgi:hypothetical protein